MPEDDDDRQGWRIEIVAALVRGDEIVRIQKCSSAAIRRCGIDHEAVAAFGSVEPIVLGVANRPKSRARRLRARGQGCTNASGDCDRAYTEVGKKRTAGHRQFLSHAVLLTKVR